jgi:hypothetical protein
VISCTAFVSRTNGAVAQPKTELNRCVSADLREDAIRFQTEDGVELPGLVFGSGSSGVLPAHTQTEVLYDWFPLARRSLLLRDEEPVRRRRADRRGGTHRPRDLVDRGGRCRHWCHGDRHGG